MLHVYLWDAAHLVGCCYRKKFAERRAPRRKILDRLHRGCTLIGAENRRAAHSFERCCHKLCNRPSFAARRTVSLTILDPSPSSIIRHRCWSRDRIYRKPPKCQQKTTMYFYYCNSQGLKVRGQFGQQLHLSAPRLERAIRSERACTTALVRLGCKNPSRKCQCYLINARFVLSVQKNPRVCALAWAQTGGGCVGFALVSSRPLFFTRRVRELYRREIVLLDT